MDQAKWHLTKIMYCDHIGAEIALETEVVYPSENLPNQPPRVIAHRCSNATMCNKFDRMACAWCFTNPDHMPV